MGRIGEFELGFAVARVLTRNCRFDMMNKQVYKTYVDLTNIIVRVSDGTPAGKQYAVLVNSHLDSTLPSPGEYPMASTHYTSLKFIL